MPRASPAIFAALAVVAVELGELARCDALLDVFLAPDTLVVPQGQLPLVLDGLACLAAARGAVDRALRLAGAADALGPSEPHWLAALCRPLVQRRLSMAGSELRPEQSAVAFSAGRSMSADQALAIARQSDTVAPRSAGVATPSRSRCTTRRTA